MRLFPAIDLREGAVVQLIGGDYAHERLRLPDALAVASGFRSSGFDAVHVVDLDAATGRGENRAVVESLLQSSGLEVQVGGGVRTDEAVGRWLDLGAARVVIGTRAVLEPSWLEQLAARHPRRLVVAADVREREVVVRGWKDGSGVGIAELVGRLGDLPLAGLLVTAVHKEGLLGGVDEQLYVELAASTVPIFASGGVATLGDIGRLRRAGVAGVVVGTALYTGDLSAADALREAQS